MSIQDIFEPNSIIKEVTDILRDRIIELEVKHHIPSGYLKTALALHIPRFSIEEIYNGGNVDYQNVFLEAQRLAVLLEEKINTLPEDFRKTLMTSLDKFSKVKRNLNGIVEVDMQGNETKIEFKQVDPKIGFMIQENLHYIGQPREDTLFHFGLFREGQEYPFAYSAYSVLDRNYLYEALPVKGKMEEILVLTRSFSANGSPINSMSLLFGAGANYIKEIEGKYYKALITAINPNTLFKGTVFKGSTFFTFATVPFLPSYYRGNYLTRKTAVETINIDSAELKTTKIECKPTIWMGFGLNKNTSQTFKECEIVNVTIESYLKG